MFLLISLCSEGKPSRAKANEFQAVGNDYWAEKGIGQWSWQLPQCRTCLQTRWLDVSISAKKLGVQSAESSFNFLTGWNWATLLTLFSVNR